jgi:omega-hydroxy-beta-dihydromenaquinone-9 sulfotransferase
MKIFVAGTGRCGTNQLVRILGAHPQVWALGETRFLVDAGGLEDLVRALTAAYTPFHADDAVSRFRALLTERVTGAEKMSSFRIFDLPGKLGRERYWNWVRRFLTDLTWYSFDEIVYDDDWQAHLAHVPRHVGRYFPVRADLNALCRAYVDELFSGAAHAHGKPIWCEKTPYNLLSMEFLWELFPEATIIHIMRHPVAVATSHLDQAWAPHDIDSVCSWLEPVYQRWLSFRQSREFDDRYIEVRLEDLATDWPR